MRLLNNIQVSFAAVVLFWRTTEAVTCNLKPSYTAPILASGWQAQLVAQNLTRPRSILFDSSGNLLVVQGGAGILHLEFDDGGGTCLDVSKKTYLVNSTDLNHGIALSNDSKTLYSSSSETLYSWTYDPTTVKTSSTNKTLITGMSNTDHTTRTLLLSSLHPTTLLISRGSSSNIDLDAESLSSGHSQIRSYNFSSSPSSHLDFATSGTLLGWGLRNSVGIAEHPITGGIYSVENSADEIERAGVDIHQNNPGEEMNFHGFLNGTADGVQGGNYGYPYCFALWNRSIPDVGELEVGSQFSLEQNGTVNDTFCGERVAPRLTFQAHMAPLDIIFLPNGTLAYITFHGSWDRSSPIGYKLSSIPFSATTGSPLDPSNSTTSTADIMTNADNSKCPDGCFRPVGLALDSKERLWMSSDSTGEIWVLDRVSGSESGSGGGIATTSGATPSATKSEGGRLMNGVAAWWVIVLLGVTGFAVCL